MKEFKIVYNDLNERYNVVGINEDKTACPIGSGKTKSQAMHNAYETHKFCQKVSKNPVEDIIILFNYEE